MMRDIEYAALAVQRQIVEKFGTQQDLSALTVVAGDKSILVEDGQQRIEGTRDNLLAWLRGSNSYHEFYQSNHRARVKS